MTREDVRGLVRRLRESLFEPEVLNPQMFDPIVKSVTGTESRRPDAYTRSQIQPVFPSFYIGPILPQQPPKTIFEMLLLERLAAVSGYIKREVTPEQVGSYILGLRDVYRAGMSQQPPINPFVRFRNNVVSIVDESVYNGLVEAHKIITRDGQGWETRAADEIDLVDRFYQFFGADMTADLLFYDRLHWVVDHYVKTARTQAKELLKSGNDDIANHLLQSARSLTQKYDMLFQVEQL